MNYYILTYAIYLPLSVFITIWVAKVLFNNGKLFLIDIFHGDKELAHSVNNLLLVGFYLVNIGYVFFTMREYGTIENERQFIELLIPKLGLIILTLGGMHFFNLFIFFRLRRNAKKHVPVA